jgi:hypothetical protein
MDFYVIENARGTKYFMLYVKEQKSQNPDWMIGDYIKANDVTFGILKGKHDADMVRIDGWAFYVFSDKFIAMLEENGEHNFDRYLLNIDDTGYEVQNRYYHIEPKNKIPRIDGSIYAHPEIEAEIEEFCQKNDAHPRFIPDEVLQQFVNNYCQKNNVREKELSMQYFINEYCQKNNVRKDDLLEITKGDIYGDFSKWDGSKILTLKDSRLIIVTEEITKIMKKMKLKNIYYEDKLNRYE